jgi:hypothetical protein
MAHGRRLYRSARHLDQLDPRRPIVPKPSAQSEFATMWRHNRAQPARKAATNYYDAACAGYAPLVGGDVDLAYWEPMTT